LIVLRTFSKSYGLAGLRVGYGAAHEALIQYLHKIRQPFNVNSLAQAAAAAALADTAFLKRTQQLVRKGKRFLYRELGALALQYLPSEANFVLVNLGCDANDCFRKMLGQGMIIRSMKAYGLETWIRVTVGLSSENVRFCRLLKQYLKQHSRGGPVAIPKKKVKGVR
jgi:histidinol-phosphate aminotransferase